MKKVMLSWLVLTLALTGCTLGPDPQRPVTVVDRADGFVHAPDEPPAAISTDVEPWWRSFGDPATITLVETALEANTDLRLAAARVVEAQTQLRSARGAKWPEATLSAGANRTKNSFVLPDVGRVAVFATTYSASLDVSYQVDLFGRLARTEQAAWAELLTQEAAQKTVLHSVIAEVVRARTQLSTQTRAVDIARETRDSWANTLATTERRYKSGLNDALDYRLARENLASAEANLVLAEQRLAQTRLGLDVLLGRRPGTGEVPEELLAPLPDLDPVPLGLPADLLDRRPDLRQAEMQLAAATSRIGIAMANLFPTLTLTGSLGTNADDLSDLISEETVIYNAIAGLLAPIFNAGQLRADVRAAEARAEQAAASYAGVILQALREVEDALVRDNAARERLAFLATQVTEAREANQIAEERYRRGVLPLLQVLETERRLRQAENTLVTAQGEAWSTRVDLFLALGGDWLLEDAPTETTQTSTLDSDDLSAEEDA
ncbi:MAG: efflux transporter outer membrane subunit [Acidobacteriota bacterium]